MVNNQLILAGAIPAALLALAAEGYFALLARRLHSTTLDTLEARAEKDALIGELDDVAGQKMRRRPRNINVKQDS